MHCQLQLNSFIDIHISSIYTGTNLKPFASTIKQAKMLTVHQLHLVPFGRATTQWCGLTLNLPEFGHGGLHGLLVLFEEHAHLPVFLCECVVLDNDLGIGTLKL